MTLLYKSGWKQRKFFGWNSGLNFGCNICKMCHECRILNIIDVRKFILSEMNSRDINKFFAIFEVCCNPREFRIARCIQIGFTKLIKMSTTKSLKLQIRHKRYNNFEPQVLTRSPPRSIYMPALATDIVPKQISMV